MDKSQAKREHPGAGAGAPRRPVARPRRDSGRAGTLAATVRHSATTDEVGRPEAVLGPAGTWLTIDSLPPANTRRWVVRRKAEVLAAINGGLLTAAEACARYAISPEELELWQKSLERAGMAGLRVTRIQLYQAAPAVKPRRTAAASAERRDLSRAWDN